MYVYMCVCMYVCTYVCMYVYMYVYVRMYSRLTYVHIWNPLYPESNLIKADNMQTISTIKENIKVGY